MRRAQTVVDYSPKPAKFEYRYIPVPGGYVTYGENQRMIVSSSPGGGPSENFSITVDMPRAGTYTVDAMWTAAVQTEVYVYSKPLTKSCTDPTMNMDDAAIPFLPEVRDGWGRGNLPNDPQRVGNLLLPEGEDNDNFHGQVLRPRPWRGRLPSTAWVEFKEQ